MSRRGGGRAAFHTVPHQSGQVALPQTLFIGRPHHVGGSLAGRSRRPHLLAGRSAGRPLLDAAAEPARRAAFAAASSGVAAVDGGHCCSSVVESGGAPRCSGCHAAAFR
eukprot:8231955-Lingulodinium_polyedra.AAC.1